MVDGIKIEGDKDRVRVEVVSSCLFSIGHGKLIAQVIDYFGSSRGRLLGEQGLPTPRPGLRCLINIEKSQLITQIIP